MTGTAADQFATKLAESLEQGTFVRVVLSSPVDPRQAPERVTGRVVDLGGERLSFTCKYGNREETRNLRFREAVEWVRVQVEAVFQSGLLATSKRDWQLITAPGKPARVVGHKPQMTAAPGRAHDQSPRRLLDDAARDWLIALEVFDAAGNLKPSMAAKHRQISHYVELLSHLGADCGWDKRPGNEASLTIADMGCGKGYLTFAAWHLVRRVWGRQVRVLGVESRPELVNKANALARKVGAEGLEFVAGDIASTPLSHLDGLIALHACNTATDAAITRGLDGGAKLIVVAPCCHQELRPRMGDPEPLKAVLRHGLMRERLAEWLTDGLRALRLEAAGYRTRMLEFVSSEHTPKNLLIAGVRTGEPDPARGREADELEAFFNLNRASVSATGKADHGTES